MDALNKQDANNGVSFFTSLRRLGKDVDLGVRDIHSKLDADSDKKQSCDDRRLALKGLRDRKKDVESVKGNASSLLKELRHGGREFEQTLQVCSDVIDAQLKQLSSIQGYLTQYGFVPQQEPESEEASEESTSDTNAASDDPPTTPPEQGTQREEVERKSKLTPCLEDFGLSSYTLNMLNRPAQQPSFKVPSAAPPQSEVHGRSTAGRQDSVPTPFQNRGLTVTPSLFSHSNCFGTGNRGMHEPFSLPCTPDMTTGMAEQATAESHRHLQSSQVNLAKTLDFSDSPVPPVLNTPGVKQIPHLSQPPAPPPQGVRGPVARQLKLGEDGGQHTDSPVPPILRTPGMQQISKTSAAGGHGNRLQHLTDRCQLELPQTPELTYSLKDLADMTISFKHVDLTSTFSESSTSIASDTMSTELPLTGIYPNQAPQKKNPPPPQPSRHGHSAKPAVPEPQLSHWSMNRLTAESIELPVTPELTMSYTSMSRADALSRAAGNVTTQAYRPGQGTYGQNTGVTSHGQVPEPSLSTTTKDRSESYKSGTGFASQGEVAEPDVSYRSRDQFDSYRPGTGIMRHRERPEPELSSKTTATLNSYRPETGITHHRERPEPKLFSKTTATFNSYRSEMGVTNRTRLPEPELSSITKNRLNSHRAGSRLAGGEEVPEPQLSDWTRDRFNTRAVDLPASPELTMSYTSLARSYTSTSHPASVVSSRKLDTHSQSASLGAEDPGSQDSSTSAHVSRSSIPVKGARSQIPRSKENAGYSGMQRPTTKGRLDFDLTGSSFPDPPRLQDPLKDSNADVPSTPNFMCSYHFMGSRK